MLIQNNPVALLPCPDYNRQQLKDIIEQLCSSLSYSIQSSAQVLLKPNLLSSTDKTGLACTHPEFVAAAAEWFLDHGAIVSIGDSPAFGTAKTVMAHTGIADALKNLPVRQVNFNNSRQVTLASGVSVGVAAAALDCDLLVNLPRVKTHSQLFVTLAVKNYFGTVVGLSKPWWHMRYGGADNRFADLIVELLDVLPGGITLVDGIEAMHKSGPMHGSPFPLHLAGASENPVAMDTALLEILGLEREKSPVWQACIKRRLIGASPEEIFYPLQSPAALQVSDFLAPQHSRPINFNPFRTAFSILRRLATLVRTRFDC